MTIEEAFEAGINSGIDIAEEEDLVRDSFYALGITCWFLGLILVCIGWK